MLERRGFSSVALSGADARCAEMRTGFPFGRQKRPHGANLELVQLQLDKHGKAKFVINFGVVPPEGADVPWQHFDQAEAPIEALPAWYRLYDCRGCMRWFGRSWLAIFGDTATQITRAVDRSIALYPEIEEWFASRSKGPHLRRVGYPLRLRKPVSR